MEYLQGQTLAERLQKTGALPAAEAVQITLQLCESPKSGTLSGPLAPRHQACY
jgi:hypothetical protein